MMYTIERVIQSVKSSDVPTGVSSSLMNSRVSFLVFILFVNIYVCLPSSVDKPGNNHFKNHQPATEYQSRHLRNKESTLQKPDAIEKDYPQLAALSLQTSENISNTNNSILDRLLSFNQNNQNNGSTHNKEPFMVEPETSSSDSNAEFKTLVFNMSSTTTAPITSPRPIEDDNDNRFYFNSELQPDETSTLPSTNSLDDKNTKAHPTGLNTTLNSSTVETSSEFPMPKDEMNVIDRLGNLFAANDIIATTESAPSFYNSNNGTLHTPDNRMQFQNDVVVDRVSNDINIDQNSRNQLSDHPQHGADLIQALRRLDFYENLRKIASRAHPNMLEPVKHILVGARQETTNSHARNPQEYLVDLTASDSSPSDSSTIKDNSKAELTLKKAQTDKISTNEDPVDDSKSRKPTQTSLTPPYSANFYHGFPPIRNLHISRASYFDAPSLAESFINNSLKSNRKLRTEKPKRVIDIANDSLTKKHRSPNDGSATFYSSSDNDIKVIKPHIPKKTNIKILKGGNQDPSTSETTSGDLSESEKNFIRDERNANESSLKKIVGDTRPLLKGSEASLTLTNDNEISDESNELINALANHFSTRQLPRVRNLSDHAAKHDFYMNDPYKKSLYYTDEPDSIGLPYKPLTIRDLARHHGVPFRLRSPFDEQFNLASPSSITGYKTTLHDARTDDFNNVKPEQGFPLDDLKLDDDLKQKSALKAIEAIAQEPDFLMRLQETLYGSGNHLSTGNMDHLHKLHSYLFRPDINLVSKTSSMASSNQMKNMLTIPTSFSPIDLSTSLSSPSKTTIDSTGRKPVNLVVTDLADKWALTRMPDLIPIPLAATVPGYLIRLPNGKILAAALTNSFTIQGIQNEPLNNGYKNFLNTKLRNLIKSNHQKHINHVASDSSLRQVILPLNQPLRASDTGRIKNQSNDIGLLRGVISHLGFGKGSSQRTNSTKDNSRVRENRSKLIKMTNHPFPVPTYNEQELSLPVAGLNDPVFSFADESQLMDQVYDPTTFRFPYYPYQQFSTMSSSSMPMIGDSSDIITSPLTAHHNYDQLSNLKGLLNGNLFISGERRGSPASRKFASPLLWLIYKAAKKLSHSLGTCDTVTGVTVAQQ